MEKSTMHANGTFEVKLTPQTAAPGIETANLGRRTIDKHFHGELDAHSLGEMIGVLTAVPGSGGYVAMERVSGRLNGKHGTFLLQHNATMNRGTPQMSVAVVPDSGTDELTGLGGAMTIQIENGQHFYRFDYSLS
jgi:hypothetical protein